MSEIREPSVSGSFYPSNPDVLRADIEGYLAKVPAQDVAGDIRGLVSPHAGYMYSGPTAAYGYKALSGRHYDTVIILAPSHQSFFVGAAVQEAGGYRTPLGVVEIDEALAGELSRSEDIVHVDPKMHRREHAIEVQIPFLQCVLADFRIVPLIMGSCPGPARLFGVGRPHLRHHQEQGRKLPHSGQFRPFSLLPLRFCGGDGQVARSGF